MVRRRALIGLCLLFFGCIPVLAWGALPVLPGEALPEPSCGDGLLNGEETGIDCGGSCSPCAPRGVTDPDVGFRMLAANEFKRYPGVVRIPGGTVTAPIVLSRSNTEYVLDGNLTAAGTALVVTRGDVTVNLNGYTVTYHSSGKGQEFGIRTDATVRNVQIVNGAIRQSGNVSLTDMTLKGSSPIGCAQPDNGTQAYSMKGSLFAGLDIHYRSASTSGIFMMWGSGNEVKHCTFTDEGYYLPDPRIYSSSWNRSGNYAAVRFPRYGSSIHHNKVLNARQCGFTVGGGSRIYQNDIRLLGRHTNGAGVTGNTVQDVEVYNNAVSGTGAHLFGFMFGADSRGVRVHHNRVALQNSPLLTNLWESYHGANGFRTTWGLSDSSVHDNTMVIGVREVPASAKRPEGQGLSLGLDAADVNVTVYGNHIEATSLDGAPRATALALHAHEGGGIEVHGNILASNDSLVAVSTDYGGSRGYPPLRDNVLRRVGDFPLLRKTVVMDEWIASNGQRTARFLSNDFGPGTSFFDIAWPTLYMGAVNDITLEHRVDLAVRAAAGAPLPGKAVIVRDNGGRIAFWGITDGAGRLRFFLPELRLTTQSSYEPAVYFTPSYVGTLNRIDLNPYTVEVDGVTFSPLTVNGDRTAEVTLP